MSSGSPRSRSRLIRLPPINVVKGNDKACDPKLPPDSACPNSANDPDDCCEGVHLLGVSWSVPGGGLGKRVCVSGCGLGKVDEDG